MHTAGSKLEPYVTPVSNRPDMLALADGPLASVGCGVVSSAGVWALPDAPALPSPVRRLCGHPARLSTAVDDSRMCTVTLTKFKIATCSGGLENATC